jgi:hypothetical protein
MNTVEVIAKLLAGEHMAREVYWCPDPDKSELRLVEVSADVNDTGAVLPLGLGWIRRNVPFPTVVTRSARATGSVSARAISSRIRTIPGSASRCASARTRATSSLVRMPER